MTVMTISAKYRTKVGWLSLVWFESWRWKLCSWRRFTEAFNVRSGLLRSVAHGGESTSSNTVGAHSLTGYTGSTHQGQGAKFSFLSGGPEFLAVHLAPLKTAYSAMFHRRQKHMGSVLHCLILLFNVCVVLAINTVLLIIHFTIIYCKVIVSETEFPTSWLDKDSSPCVSPGAAASSDI